ncbi:MAG: DHH family phosphoesterase, partial [Desulfurococcaceae archaeon TW002]
MSYLEDMEKLIELTRKLINTFKNYSTICFTTHKDADPDAVASIIGVRFITESLFSNIKTSATLPEGLNKVSTKIVKSLGFEGDLVTAVGSCDLIVCVDVSSKSQVPILDVAGSRDYVVIDHHETNELSK